MMTDTSLLSLLMPPRRNSTVGIKSPVDEGAAKPWTDEEPPSPFRGVWYSRARIVLTANARKGQHTGEGECQNGQHKLQAVFERAQHDSKDSEGDAANVDWGEYPSGRIYYSAHVCVAFWGAVVSGTCVQCVTYSI